jgi:hypothetical protein
MGARFSPAGYSLLINRAEKDEVLAERVGVRLDTPVNILKALLQKVTEAVRTRMMRSATPEIRQRIQSAIDTMGADAEGRLTLPIDYDESSNAVLEMNRFGLLNEAAISRFARDGEYGNCIVALSLLTKAPADMIEPLFCNEKPDGLIVACRAANLGWATVLMILRSRPGQPPSKLLDLEQCRHMFQAITLVSAQRTMQAWSEKHAAGKSGNAKALAATA